MNRSPALRLCSALVCLLLAACAGQDALRADAAPAEAVRMGAAQPSTVIGTQPVSTEPALSVTTLPDGAEAPPIAIEQAPAVDAVSSDSGASDPQPAEPSAPSEAAPAPTQAELDYAAIYGVPYDPVADPTLPTPVQMPISHDPWEPFNRRMHAINNRLDRYVATPLADFYIAVTPRPVRLGVTNFFNNLGQPVNAVNALLQGRPKQAGQSLGRFVVNSTIGLAGFFDPATRMDIPNRSEDFGQTLGRWGWKRSRYLELPLLGPRTVRDMVGMMGDSPLSPYPHIENDKVRVFTQGLQLVDIRTQLKAVDSMREGAVDEYALYRDAWMQRRHYQIFGDAGVQSDETLPDYLQDDADMPMIPVDAVPVIQP